MGSLHSDLITTLAYLEYINVGLSDRYRGNMNLIPSLAMFLCQELKLDLIGCRGNVVCSHY